MIVDENVSQAIVEDGVTSTADAVMFTELAFAYNFINQEMFDGRLESCIVTTNRKYGSLGYFRPRGFNAGGRCANEISLNAAYMSVRTTRSTLGILASLMCHAKNAQDGFTGKKGYCGKIWAKTMKHIGLMPSSTGRPGGAPTGYNNSFYIVKGEAFDLSCCRLQRAKFTLTWHDRFPFRPPSRQSSEDIRTYRDVVLVKDGSQEMQTASMNLGIPAALLTAQRAADLSMTCLPLGNKHRAAKDCYVCGGCGAKLWGKPGLAVKCLHCDRAFLPL
jgi:hypothetical protein